MIKDNYKNSDGFPQFWMRACAAGFFVRSFGRVKPGTKVQLRASGAASLRRSSKPILKKCIQIAWNVVYYAVYYYTGFCAKRVEQ